jgi:hypothetical protein
LGNSGIDIDVQHVTDKEVLAIFEKVKKIWAQC